MNWLATGLGKILNFGKWGLLFGGGGLAAEQLTDDGQGGVISRGAQNIAKKFIESTSTEQGRNIGIDSFYSGAGIGSYLMGLVASVARAFGFESFAQRMESRMHDQIRAVNESARTFKGDGSVFDEAMTDSARSGLEKAQALVSNAGNSISETLGEDNIITTTTQDLTGLDADTATAVGTGALALGAAYAGKRMLSGGAAVGSAATNATRSGVFNRAANSLLGATAFGKAARIGLAAAGAYGAVQLADNHTPNPNDAISITQDPIGFVANLGEGIKSINESTFQENMWNGWNLTKSFTVGATTGTTWLAGQALDFADSAVDYVAGTSYDSTHNFSEEFSKWTNESTASLLGGVDMTSAWAQTANFAGGMVGPGAAVGTVAKGTGFLIRTTRGTAQFNAAQAAAVAPTAATGPSTPALVIP